MAWYLYLASIIWIATGVIAILYTDGERELVRKVIQDAKKNRNLLFPQPNMPNE